MNIVSQATTEKNMDTENSVGSTAKRYFIGYAVLQIAIKKYACESCKEIMMKSTKELLKLPSEMLIANKNFNEGFAEMGLQASSDLLFTICKIHFDVFDYFFKNYMHITSLKASIIEACINLFSLPTSSIRDYLY